jgi:hypothetical protein
VLASFSAPELSALLAPPDSPLDFHLNYAIDHAGQVLIQSQESLRPDLWLVAIVSKAFAGFPQLVRGKQAVPLW